MRWGNRDHAGRRWIAIQSRQHHRAKVIIGGVRDVWELAAGAALVEVVDPQLELDGLTGAQLIALADKLRGPRDQSST